jgi:hypothetical protein
MKMTDAELRYECGQTTYLCGWCGKSNRICEQCPCFAKEEAEESNKAKAEGKMKWKN